MTLKLRRGVPGLRRKDVFECLVGTLAEARENGLRIAHFAILSNHVHLILDPPERSLPRLMQSFCISFARRLNRLSGRAGAVFFGRYDLVVLRTPTQVRNALAYVLTNEAKHHAIGGPAVVLDPYSSAVLFKEWRKLFRQRLRFARSNWSEASVLNRVEAIAGAPRTWLLRQGWTRAGPKGLGRGC